MPTIHDQTFTAWDKLAPITSPRPAGMGAFVDDRFCVPETAADAAALTTFVGEAGPAGEVSNGNMSGVIPMIGFTEWDQLASAAGDQYPRQDLRLSGLSKIGTYEGPMPAADPDGGRYQEFDFCRPMPYDGPPAGLAGLGACCDDCAAGGSCECGGLGGVGFLPQWLTHPSSIQDWLLLGLLGYVAVVAITPIVFPGAAKSAKRKALRKARLKAKARRAQIAAEYA